ncbi:PKD-like family lipoprotein [Pedobacter jeongneungensis]|uniref:PKD-like family lipoprotein n=1 Tax=Pedobacter jeongneungensis TaxID=947309 RepID=UPI0004688F1C|nr:PKD-like family lipoprotein [Pedobacter jeongneungensis]
MLSLKYKLSIVIAALVIFCAMYGCKKNNNDITPLPDITISATTVSEKFIGDVLSINPTVAYGGQEANFTYKWFKTVQASSSLTVYKQISDKKALSYTLDSLGTLNLKFEVSNTVTGVSSFSKISFNVVSRAERGWYLLKATADGNTEMDAFYTNAVGNQSVTNIITAKNGAPMAGLPVDIGFTAFYTWYNPITKFFVSNNTCLIPVSSKEVLAYRVRDERILSSTDGLFYEPPVPASRNFQALVCDPNLMGIVNDGAAQGMDPNSSSFLPQRSGDYSLSPYFTLAPYKFNNANVGYILGFDKKSASFVTLRYKQTDISYFPDRFLTGSKFSYPYNVSSNKMGAQLVFMGNTDGTLDSLQSSNGRAYGLLKKDNSSDMMLVGLNTELLLPSRYGNGNFSPIAFKRDLLSSSYPDLASASLFAINKNNPIIYFAKGSNLGYYNIDTQVYSSSMYNFGGEEITYVKFIDAQYDAITANNFRNLVVATYLNGKYKVYRFTVLGTTLTQTGAVFEGTGRIKSLIYAVPNGNSTATFTSLFHSMYRYY